MLTSKQRSYLKSLAHDLDPALLIGKGGITDNVLNELDIHLEHRELVKVKLQEGCDYDPKDIANKLAIELRAEFVQAIGRKFVLYRESKDHKKIELPKDSKKSSKRT